MKVIIEEIVSNNNVNVEDNSIIHIVHIEEFESVSNHSQLNFDDGTNPHGTTKQDVGLRDVPNLNTTDAVNKAHEHTNFSVLNGTEESFTTALKNAYNSAVSWITTNGTNLINHITNYSNPHSVTKSQVGLGSVDNTSDADKPISNATQGALNNKADLVGGKVPLSQLPAISQDLKLLHKNHISGISVVNNPNFTYKYAYGVLIPGGTIQVGDFIDIEVSFEKVSGGSAELYPRIGINTINGTAGEVVISYSFYGNTAVYGKIQRSLVVKAGNLTEILHHGTSSGVSWNAAAASGNKNIDWSTNKYLVISIANNGALDATWRVSSVIITKK